MDQSLNVFGLPLIECSINPLTGFFRNGCCDTNEQDFGVHTVCTIVDSEFLTFSKEMGNDLSTPRPEYNFAGLKPGDRWCLCAARWKEAFDAGKAPQVILEATHERTLDLIPLSELVKFAHKTVTT